jgi:cellulose synthase/poly-beta-1,6-N-acetylglucosamine synthase-like glycosyltransferase
MWWEYFCLIGVAWSIIQYGLLYLLLTLGFKKYGWDSGRSDISQADEKKQGRFEKEEYKGQNDWPSVAVLVPARNEESVLSDCLRSFEELDYPEDKITFFLADDQSEDSTGSIIETWVRGGANRQQIKVIPAKDPGINGKANALAQMVDRTDAGFLLFSDADCKVPATWVKSMVGACGPTCGVVTGMTKVEAKGFLGRMQALDWWLTLGLVKVTSDLGFSLTAMGNNMLVSREAYKAAGGFDRVKHHLTEDLALSAAISEKGYHPIHHVDRSCLITTQPQKSFSELMGQRKRWVDGVFLLPLYWQALLMVQVGFYPVLIALMLAMPLTGLLLWMAKLSLQSVFILTFASKVETKIPALDLLSFEFYYCCTSWSTVGYYFWPGKTNWKKRKY